MNFQHLQKDSKNAILKISGTCSLYAEHICQNSQVMKILINIYTLY